jgi:hypothetical protein
MTALTATRLRRGAARLWVPPFSAPVPPAIIRYVAFRPDATPSQVAFHERMLIECRSDLRAAVGVALSDTVAPEVSTSRL